MKKTIMSAMAVLVSLALAAGCASSPETGGGPERSDVLYACACGESCSCNTLSTQPGQCACGKALGWHHVVKVEGNEALLCTCGQGCACTISPSDPAKCTCGGDIRRVSLEGSGVYFCNCGGSCTCNTVSDQPGLCRCGMNLKKI